MDYRLGLDLGTNSIGWAIVKLHPETDHEGKAYLKPVQLVRMGSRIFGDGRNPKDGSSLAVQRRGPRQQRRRRDRYIGRRNALMYTLVKSGLMPKDIGERKQLELLNPYALRAQGLDQQISLHELGRAIFHMNQRRGFQSNRKTDKAAGNESGKIKSSITLFKEQITQLKARTVGEALYKRLKGIDTEDGQRQGTRARLLGSGAKDGYDIYYNRDMLKDEFNQLWDEQAKFHSQTLTDSLKKHLFDIIFHQRPLKPVLAGKCTLEPARYNKEDLRTHRAPMALPSAQQFRLYQELNHLRIMVRHNGEQYALSHQERDTLAHALLRKPKLGLEKLRELIKGKENAPAFVFTLELEADRKELKGDETSAQLYHKKCFGEQWFNFSLVEQDEIVWQLLEEIDEDRLIEWLQTQYALSPEQADAVANVRLVDGHARLGQHAIHAVLPHLQNGWDEDKNQPLTYDKAVLAAGFDDHRAQYGGSARPELPYYGEILERYLQDASTAGNLDEQKYGKIANPTVHIGLRQLQKLVNAVIKKYGKPTQIHLELARDLKANQEQKDRMRKQNKANRERNDEYQKILERLGQSNNAENRLRLRLLYELPANSRQCIYSGERLSINQALFSDAFQIDHILPFSQTLDDSIHNKVLVHRSANRYKRDRSPYEAFSIDQGWKDGYDEILGRALEAYEHNPQKLKRFQVSSAEEWLSENDDFLARQLTDTQYLSRVAREYLNCLYPADERNGNQRIVVSPGRLTDLVRGKLGFSKDRNDHRHHAVDAAVIAIIDRALLQRVSTIASRAREQSLERLFGDFPQPWPNFRLDVLAAKERSVVSHKPDHGAQAGLHEETAYGPMGGPDDKGVYTVRVHKPVTAIKKYDDLDGILNSKLAEFFKRELEMTPQNQFVEQFMARCHDLKINRLRIQTRISGVAIKDKRNPDGLPYKIYKGGSNHCYELYVNEKGKWDGDLITTFIANQKAYLTFMGSDKTKKGQEQYQRYLKQTFGGKHLLMRLMRDDLIAIDEIIEEKIVCKVMRVQQMTVGKIILVEHFEANVDARDRDRENDFKYTTMAPSKLQKLNARRVFVNFLGQVLDPKRKVSPKIKE